MMKGETNNNMMMMVAVADATKSLQSCPTLCDPMDCSLPGSSIHVIFQGRVLEWGAIASSGWWWSMDINWFKNKNVMEGKVQSE